MSKDFLRVPVGKGATYTRMRGFVSVGQLLENSFSSAKVKVDEYPPLYKKALEALRALREAGAVTEDNHLQVESLFTSIILNIKKFGDDHIFERLCVLSYIVTYREGGEGRNYLVKRYIPLSDRYLTVLDIGLLTAIVKKERSAFNLLAELTSLVKAGQKEEFDPYVFDVKLLTALTEKASDPYPILAILAKAGAVTEDNHSRVVHFVTLFDNTSADPWVLRTLAEAGLLVTKDNKDNLVEVGAIFTSIKDSLIEEFYETRIRISKSDYMSRACAVLGDLARAGAVTEDNFSAVKRFFSFIPKGGSYRRVSSKQMFSSLRDLTNAVINENLSPKVVNIALLTHIANTTRDSPSHSKQYYLNKIWSALLLLARKVKEGNVDPEALAFNYLINKDYYWYEEIVELDRDPAALRSVFTSL